MGPVELGQSKEKPSGFPSDRIGRAGSIRDIFRVDPAIGVSKFRTYLLRGFYALIFIGLAPNVWSEIFTHKALWEPLPGIAFSFWAAFSVLTILGIRYPLKMIPLLLVQLSYKVIWLVIVAYPLWSVDQLSGSALELTKTNLIAAVGDLLVIPWPYVWRNFILGPKKI